MIGTPSFISKHHFPIARGSCPGGERSSESSALGATPPKQIVNVRDCSLLKTQI